MEINRLKVGILFNFSSSWMGGIIYIINLVKTLNHLDDDEKPEIFLFYNPALEEFLEEFDYPYLTLIRWSFPPMIKGWIKSWILRKNLFILKILKQYELNAVFPLQDYPVRTKTKVKLISWSPDFQQKYYPEFFTRMNRFGRNLRGRRTLRNTDDLVLSSHDAHKDLTKFFKVRASMAIHVYHFVSIIDEPGEVNFEDLRSKYKLPEKYFLISNQFHKHKNHRAAFLAISKLKESGVKKHLAITGKFPRASDSPYLSELHKIIEENELQDQVTLLGIISRSDQLYIMKHSQAVVQPSLFEGWSTVIEDARSLQVPVVASSLNVNIEQLGENGIYFDPHNPDELAKILKDYPERNLDDIFYEEYKIRVKKAAITLMEVFRSES